MSQADELLKYKELLESGAITQEEFNAMKAKILGTQQPSKQDTVLNDFVTRPKQENTASYSSVANSTTTKNLLNNNGNVFKVRIGMKIAGIVCVVLAVIYLFIAISSGISMIVMAAFFGITSFMFFTLSKVPKAYKHIGKDDTGLKKNMFVILCVVVAFIIVGAVSGSEGSSNKNSASDTEASVTDIRESNEEESATEESTTEEPAVEEPAIEESTIELANEFEKVLYDAVNNNNGTVTNIYFEEASDSNNKTSSEYVEFVCDNNEDTVQGIINQLVEAQKSDGSCAVCVIVKESEDSLSNLVIADIDIDGNLTMTFESPNYNSSRNLWISGQFSAWDSSHTELTKLIKQSLNDEKSYDHINTTYRDIKTQEDADAINKILNDANYSARVEVRDLFIMTNFSAKNGFNATVKSTAYGIASYNNNYITLIGIE